MNEKIFIEQYKLIYKQYLSQRNLSLVIMFLMVIGILSGIGLGSMYFLDSTEKDNSIFLILGILVSMFSLFCLKMTTNIRAVTYQILIFKENVKELNINDEEVIKINKELDILERNLKGKK